MRLLMRFGLIIFGSTLLAVAGIQHRLALQDEPQGWLLYSTIQEGTEQIYRLWSDGSHQDHLAYNTFSNTSRDPHWIYFSSDFTGNYDIYRMDWGRSELQNITPGSGIDVLAHVSADGKWLYFLSQRNGSTLSPYRMRLDGSEIQALTSAGTQLSKAAISNMAQSFVFASARNGNYEIYRLDLDDPQWYNLTESPASDEYPHISPDNQWVVYSAYDTDNYDLYRMRLDGSGRKQLTQTAVWEMKPLFSPDSRWLFYLQNSHNRSEIYRMRSDGSQPEKLSQDAAWATNPILSPDGQWLFYSSQQGNDLEIYRMHTDGTGVQQLTHNSLDDTPVTFIPLPPIPSHRPAFIGMGVMLILGGLGLRRWRK